MEELIEILEDIDPSVDYNECTTLVTDNYLDSLAIISLVAEIEEKFDVQIPTVEIITDNFNFAKAICELIERLKEEE